MEYDYIQANFAFIVTTTFLLLFLFNYRTFNKKITHLFMTAVLLSLALFVVENLSVWSSELPHPTFLRRFTSALGYSIRPLIILMLILVVYRGRIKKKLLLFVPAIINICISFTGLFSEISFYFSEDNEFRRGPLGYTTHIVAAVYFVVLLIATTRFFKEKSYYEGVLIAIIEASNVIATVLESVWNYKGLLRTSIVLSLAFYYIFFQTQSTKRDSLTGALKRRYLYLDADRLKGNLQAIISLDLNNLKTLNDTIGHSEGDKAILTLVNCVYDTMPYGFTLYRTGGDEFTILCSKCDITQINVFKDKLKDKLSETPYTCAVGFALFEEGNTFEEVLKKSDAAMYEDKMQMKKTMK